MISQTGGATTVGAKMTLRVFLVERLGPGLYLFPRWEEEGLSLLYLVYVSLLPAVQRDTPD